MSIVKNFFNASLQLGELNVQASRILMEESAAALQKGMQLRTLADTQSFIIEQSQMAVDKMRGYRQNVQNIAAKNRIGLDKVLDAQTAQPDNAQGQAAGKDDALHGPHETDHHPSALVEKLIASVVSDTDKLREQS